MYVVHTCVFAVYFTSAAWRNYELYQGMRRKPVVDADSLAYTSERKTRYLPHVMSSHVEDHDPYNVLHPRSQLATSVFVPWGKRQMTASFQIFSPPIFYFNPLILPVVRFSTCFLFFPLL